MRTFVAVEVPEEIRRALVETQEELRRGGVRIRWSSRDQMHLTLKFLGEIDQGSVESLSAGMRAATALRSSFEVEIRGVGTFPERGAPRVVWAGGTGALDALSSLAAEVESVAETVGVAKEGRPYSPHLTLGRVKDPKGARDLPSLLPKWQDRSYGKFLVRSVVLFRSDLRPEGAVYTRLEEFPFLRS